METSCGSSAEISKKLSALEHPSSASQSSCSCCTSINSTLDVAGFAVPMSEAVAGSATPMTEPTMVAEEDCEAAGAGAAVEADAAADAMEA
eukprot:CAMPEP_0181179486 /NCGR_PEP_ID=MMETSP1096-20121128/6288_1 /TAXON_ID=156174 ORGANISM="Chrysochromulina ericina, Strain CCMP281" /NCGR_SAMPLE_ID=MMETSP1096 /ASSEMBLY_ACC=CAM_ASM_000453 /LENGTH=90 /DNA_ID=CAMNT_0023267843 /DNA_START=229 /DNA_END=501 /DNA_ORIENTATION=+